MTRTNLALMIGAVAAAYFLGQVGRGAVGNETGPFRLESQGNGTGVWQVDTSSGAVRLCRVPVAWPGMPDCGSWHGAE